MAESSGRVVVRFAGGEQAVEWRGARACEIVELACGESTPGSLPPGAPSVDADLLLRPSGRGVELVRGERRLWRGSRIGDGVERLLEELLESFVDGHDAGLMLHCGVVSRDEAALLLPARSGSGKSTLVAGLALLGWSYHTDELAAVTLPEDGERGSVWGLRRPVHLKGASIGVVADLPGAAAALAQRPLVPSHRGAFLAAEALGPAYGEPPVEVRAIVFPGFEAGRGARLDRVTPGRALASLHGTLLNGRNLEAGGAPALRDLALAAPAFELRFGALEGAARELFRILG